jgi:hypothetical protein
MPNPTTHTKFNVKQLAGTVPEVALSEPGAILAEAIPVTLTDVANSVDFTYSATATDNGTAGDLSGQPGVIYSGPSGMAVRVAVAGVDTLEHAITLPEATDTAALTLWKNSVAVGYGDEGFNAHASEIAVENNVDTIVAELNEGDVLRVGFTFTGEVDADLDVAPGIMAIT